MTRIDDDDLIGRLRASRPMSGVGVDFDAVAAEVGQRRRVRRGAVAMAGSALTVLVLAVGAQTVGRPAVPVIASPDPSSRPVAAAGQTTGAVSQPASSAAVQPTTRQQVAEDASGCPLAWSAPEVPEPPVGFDLADALVPPDLPSSVTICRYAVRSLSAGPTPSVVTSAGPPYPLTALARLDTGLAHVRDDLRLVRRSAGVIRSCPLAMSASFYVTLFEYGAGRYVWVATQDGACAKTTNGAFTSDAHVAKGLAHALGSGSWPGFAAPSAPCEPALGRLGSDAELLPGVVTRITVCRPRIDGGLDPTVVDLAAGGSAIVAALRALSPEPLGDCPVTGSDGGREALYVVVSFAAGPDQVVTLDPRLCAPVTTDLLKAADPSGSVRVAVASALGG